MIKINLELPEFDKELSISVTLRKDGEVVYTSSSSPGVKTEVSPANTKKAARAENVKPIAEPKKTGNLMDMNF